MTTDVVPLDDLVATGVDLSDESETVRRTVEVIARLLGEPGGIRQPHDLASFVALHLGHTPDGIAKVRRTLPGLLQLLVRAELGRLLAQPPVGSSFRDDTGTQAPGFDMVTVAPGEEIAAPADLAVYLPADTVFAFDAVLVVYAEYPPRVVALHVARSDADSARDALAVLVRECRTRRNFLRGQTVRARMWGGQLLLEPVPPASTDRADVVHADRVWQEIDVNVGGLTRHACDLVAAGLGAARGLLLAGPPGVGKTALCRVIASEAAPGTTIVLVDPAVFGGLLDSLYDAIEDLTPAIVFLDDIDLFAGNRATGRPGYSLADFLNRLDGFRPTGAVLTVATTNVTADLDPALVRPGRFDTILEIGAPDATARAAILRRYLGALGEFDVSPLTAMTQGMTGADLREIVRRGVLEQGSSVTVAHLIEIATTGRWKPSAPTGQYL